MTQICDSLAALRCSLFFLQMIDAELQYKQCVSDARIQQDELVKVKERIISHIRKLICQGDTVLKEVGMKLRKLIIVFLLACFFFSTATSKHTWLNLVKACCNSAMHLFSHKVNLSNLNHHTQICCISASAKIHVDAINLSLFSNKSFSAFSTSFCDPTHLLCLHLHFCKNKCIYLLEWRSKSLIASFSLVELKV